MPKEQESELMLTHEITKMFHDLIRHDEDTDRRNATCRHLLRHLSQKDGRTQLELSQLVHLTPPSISIALQKMENEGLILRTQDPTDLRSTRVYLTQAGKDAHKSDFQRVRALEEKAMSCFTKEEKEDFRKMLLTLRTQISEMILKGDQG